MKIMITNNKKIVICDDDVGILDVLEMILEKEGFEVTTEIDSTRLINILKVENPALLLLDLWMQGLSGYDIIRLVREDPEINTLPITVLSASRNEVEVALGAGDNRFLAKPFDIKDIVLLVNQAMAGFENPKNRL